MPKSKKPSTAAATASTPSGSKSSYSSAPIFFFKDDEKPYGCFCQWYQAPFTYHGLEFPDGQQFLCAEQFYMWRKAMHFGDTDTAREIVKEKNPRKQKALGRGVKGFTDEEWDKFKVQYCEEASMLKYTQCVTREDDGNGPNVPLKDVLLQTGDRELFEASPFDKIWGIGVKAEVAQSGGASRKTWGLNLLGKSLMKTRDVLRAREEGGPALKGES